MTLYKGVSRKFGPIHGAKNSARAMVSPRRISSRLDDSCGLRASAVTVHASLVFGSQLGQGLLRLPLALRRAQVGAARD